MEKKKYFPPAMELIGDDMDVALLGTSPFVTGETEGGIGIQIVDDDDWDDDIEGL